jgi:hypothetical protein
LDNQDNWSFNQDNENGGYDMSSWLILGLIAASSLALLGLLRRARAAGQSADFGVSVDDEWIRRRGPSLDEAVRWDDLERIAIVTTDEGPFTEDVFWLFIGRGGTGCALPGAAVGDEVFERLKRLPGIDYEAVITAMGSAENASFEVWARPGVQ